RESSLACSLRFRSDDAVPDLPHHNDTRLVSCRYRPECHGRITALHPLISMYQLPFRWPLALFGAAIVIAIVLLALGGLAGRTHDLASIAQRESECAHAAREYRRLPHVVPGKIIATV